MISKSCLALYFLFLLSFILCAREQLMFFKRNGKELMVFTPDAAYTVSINQAPECIGKCLDKEWCKSFHVYRNEKMCDLFPVDRCSLNVTLGNATGFSYFDMIPGKCPPGKCEISKILINSYTFCRNTMLINN